MARHFAFVLASTHEGARDEAVFWRSTRGRHS
jgi:hypothetical protein